MFYKLYSPAKNLYNCGGAEYGEMLQIKPRVPCLLLNIQGNKFDPFYEVVFLHSFLRVFICLFYSQEERQKCCFKSFSPLSLFYNSIEIYFKIFCYP